MDRSGKDYALLTLKGIAMGAADVVPGVSGGTIAFIVGIYEELLDSIKSINLSTLKLLLQGRIGTFWKLVNGNFLLFLVAGIGISILSLARVITYLLVHQPVLIWSFFFGLVLASTWFVAKDIRRWDWKRILGFLLGGAMAYYVTVATPAETPDHPLFIFLCGMIAICAMILPGISGSFILLLLGKYQYIMEAVKSMDKHSLLILCTFGCGAAIGITSFSRVLSYALKHYHDTTIAILGGFMLGSLNKVWPWKETIAGAETNIAPDGHVGEAVFLMLVGFFAVYFLEKLSISKEENK
ncbi:MAG TPA: DUF368 domain-containing protein [Parabacteroides sp.]|nr:DUF368 domain-containing protein [Parabacteroides sp.]